MALEFSNLPRDLLPGVLTSTAPTFPRGLINNAILPGLGPAAPEILRGLPA